MEIQTDITRILRTEDVVELTDLLCRNRSFLSPWDPERDDDFFTVTKQHDIARASLDTYSDGSMVPLVITDAKGTIVGRLNINGIVRGAFQSAAIGYWVSERVNGLGFASAAVAEAIKISTSLGLHRLQAETLIHNKSSQRVLEKNGFTLYGLAPKYLKIAGTWQDHLLFQRINE